MELSPEQIEIYRAGLRRQVAEHRQQQLDRQRLGGADLER